MTCFKSKSPYYKDMVTESFKQHLLETAAGLQWREIGIHHHHGIALPLFSLRSQYSCGIGEFPDLIPLIPWCRELGMDVIQFLPLNDTGPETSPYSALSAFALNPIHLGLNNLSHINEDQQLKKQIVEMQQLNNTPRINYSQVHKQKEKFLKEYYNKYSNRIENDPAFLTFKNRHQQWLLPYSIFKALKIRYQWQSWEEWPPQYRDPSDEFLSYPPADIAEESKYHIFLQYLCFEQLKEIKSLANQQEVLIKGDIPILINRESADVWKHRDLFLLQYAAGAPPDMYAPQGQKWGFPLYNWDVMAHKKYQWWIERLAVAQEFYNLYRLDHIVGFFRIWGIPIDKSSENGTFIPENRSKWIPSGTIIMQVMLRHSDMLPIGEDLGTVPPEVRVCLKALGICGTKVMRWERRWNEDRGFISPNDYPLESMTTVSTHDSEPLELWWKNQTDEACLYAMAQGWDYNPLITPKQRVAILRASHHSGSLFHINLLNEYLALDPDMVWADPEDERINVPGTISDENWTYRFKPSVEEIVNNQLIKEIITHLIK